MNINQNIIKISDISVKVIRKKIKNIHLAVYPPDGWVRVAVPEIINDEAVRLVVISKLGWIRRQQKSFKEQPRQDKRELITGESLYFLGHRYILEVIHSNKKPKIFLKNKKTLCLKINNKTTFEKREQLLNKWYRVELKKLLANIVKKWENKMNIKTNSCNIRKMKSRWGTCNVKNRVVTLNLELVKKPIECVEYILVHEFAHLLERTHNKRFKQILNKYIPNWKTRRKWLNNLPLLN